MSIFWPNVLAVLILAAFIRHRWVRTRSLVEPGVLFAANLILLYPLRSFILRISTSATPNYPDLLLGNNLEQASWLAVLGCVGFVCGYLLILRDQKLAILHGTATPRRFDDVLVCSVFFLGSLVGIVFKIATGDYMSYLLPDRPIPAISHIGTMLADLQWPTFIGVWVLWFRGVRKPAFLALFLAVQFVVVPFQFIQGSKTFLSLLMVSIVVAYYWSQAKLPKLMVMAAVAFVAFFVFPYVQSFRSFVNEKYGRIPSLSTLDFRGFRSTYIEDTSASAEDRLFAVSSRYGGIDELYEITQVIPRLLPYRFGAEYGNVFVNLVPRAAWPDKPSFSHGAVYGSALNTITSVTPFPFGEAYWDGGIPGLPISMMVWGIALGGILRLYEHFYRKPGMSLFIALYFLSQIYWITGTDSFMPSAISSLPQQAALLWFLYMALRLLRPLHRFETPKLRSVA